MYRLVVLALAAMVIAAVGAGAATAKPRGVNGKIVINGDNNVTGHEQVYTVNPDGSDLTLLLNDAEAGQWSPDGTRIAMGSESCSGGGVFYFDAGTCNSLNLSTQYPNLFLGCGTWSPDGTRLACEGGFIDPALQGVYTVRSADGGDLQQVTSDPGGDDFQGDYSPNGKQLVFIRANDSVLALFTVKLDGSGLRQITPNGMALNFNGGSWSPQGNEILFSAHVPDFSYRSTTWVVHSDGTGLHEIPIPGCGGLISDANSISCPNPSWSPDGTKIVFSRFTAATGQRDIYTVNLDGSDLTQVTNTPDVDEFTADWGTHPVTP